MVMIILRGQLEKSESPHNPTSSSEAVATGSHPHEKEKEEGIITTETTTTTSIITAATDTAPTTTTITTWTWTGQWSFGSTHSGQTPSRTGATTILTAGGSDPPGTASMTAPSFKKTEEKLTPAATAATVPPACSPPPRSPSSAKRAPSSSHHPSSSSSSPAAFPVHTMPFRYTWERSVDPHQVTVPSATASPQVITLHSLYWARIRTTSEQPPTPPLESTYTTTAPPPTDATTPLPTAAAPPPSATPADDSQPKEDPQGQIPDPSSKEATSTFLEPVAAESTPAPVVAAGATEDEKVDHENNELIPAPSANAPPTLTPSSAPTSPTRAVASMAPTTTTFADLLSLPPSSSSSSSSSSSLPPEDSQASTDKDTSSLPLPPSGHWQGYFETAGVGRKGPPVKVMESFVIFMKENPSPQVSWSFSDPYPGAQDHHALDSSTGQDPPSTTTTTQVMASSPPRRVHVQGAGENQYGVFELLGWYDRVTGVMELQRIYIPTARKTIGSSPSGRSVGRPRSSHRPRAASTSSSMPPSSAAADATTPAVDAEGRPYFTRKRQLSWKRRAALEGDGPSPSPESSGLAPSSTLSGAEDEGLPSQPRVRRGVGRPPSRKKVRIMESPGMSSATGGPVVAEGLSLEAAATTPDPTQAAGHSSQINEDVPGSGSALPWLLTKTSVVTTPLAAGASPAAALTGKRATTPLSNTASNAGPKGAGGAPSTGAAATFPGVGNAGGIQLKLPAAGEPSLARWRAAHFLYYQRHDPPPQEELLPQQQPQAPPLQPGLPTHPPPPALPTIPVAAAVATSASSSSSNTPPKYVVYEGEMLDSYREGRGVCLYNGGLLYEGEWKRDKEHGFGVLMTSDRKHVIYKGEWERGRMNGKGIYHYSERKKGKRTLEGGSRYEGDFKENLRHGTGTYVFPCGSVYTGTWRDGLMSGRGVFTWPDGKSVYDGEWKDGKRHGQGTLTAADGFTYDGTWHQNAMEGRGSATYPDGQQYNGLFSLGRREGRGTVHFTNGATYEGRFIDDAVAGQGTMKMSRTMVVPRPPLVVEDSPQQGQETDAEASEKHDEKSMDVEKFQPEEPLKDDFMIPISFQSDIGHIHRRAGFTHIGE